MFLFHLIKTSYRQEMAWPHLSPKFFPPGSFSSQFFLPNKNSPWIKSSQALILLALYSPLFFDNTPKTIYIQELIFLAENSPKTFSSKAMRDSIINPPRRKFSQNKLHPGLNTPENSFAQDLILPQCFQVNFPPISKTWSKGNRDIFLLLFLRTCQNFPPFCENLTE